MRRLEENSEKEMENPGPLGDGQATEAGKISDSAASSSTQNDPPPPEEPVPTEILGRLQTASQFVYDYLIQLGLNDQAQVLEDFFKGEAFRGYGAICGLAASEYWVLLLTVVSKASPITLSRAELGPRMSPKTPTAPPVNLDEDWESTLKIKVVNELVYQYLAGLDLTSAANEFKECVQQGEAAGLKFSQLPFLHCYLDILQQFRFAADSGPWGELGPIFPDILPDLGNFGLEWEFGPPDPTSGDISADDYEIDTMELRQT